MFFIWLTVTNTSPRSVWSYLLYISLQFIIVLLSCIWIHNTRTSTVAHCSIQFIIVYSYLMKHVTTTFIYGMSHNNHIHIPDITQQPHTYTGCHQYSHPYTECHHYTFILDFNWLSKIKTSKFMSSTFQ